MIAERLASPTPDITEADWPNTPASVQQFIWNLLQQLTALEAEVQSLKEENRVLRERLGSPSQNSAQPPSADGPAVPPRPAKAPSGKPRGGPPGHPGHARVLYPVAAGPRVENHRPPQGRQGGEPLSGEDPEPYRHPVVELLPIRPLVEEHRLHQLTCAACGATTRAVLPESVTASGYGPRVVATTALLSSERVLPKALPTAGIPTGKAWLWVAVTEGVAVLLVQRSRGQDAARALLGASFSGRLVSDRWWGYNWVRLGGWQLCWAHRKREFTKIAEREGESGRIGQGLLEQEARLFAYWQRVRDGTLAWSTFQKYAGDVRQRIKALLMEGAAYRPVKGEQSARAQTAHTGRDLLKMEPALWLFVRVRYQAHEQYLRADDSSCGVVAPDELWLAVCRGQRIRGPYADRDHDATVTKAECAGVPDTSVPSGAHRSSRSLVAAQYPVSGYKKYIAQLGSALTRRT